MVLVALISIGLFVTVGALALRQVTAPGTATSLLKAGIASTVDIDRYLADELPALRAWAALPGSETTDLPGFPIEVFVTADEVRGDPAALREMVLSRSAAIVYTEGASAFDRTGNQSIELLSGESVVRVLVDNANATNHSRAGWVAVVAAAVLTLSGALYATPRDGRRRFRSLGGALVIGTVPGILLSGFARVLAGQYGAPDDPYAAEIRDVIRAAVSIPFRDFVICLGAATAVVAVGVALELVDRLWPARVADTP